jgi:hypothetical protein
MKKVIQTSETLLDSLSVLEANWKDDYADKVISFFDKIEYVNFEDASSSLKELLDIDFDLASTVFRIFIEKSKDEYTSLLKSMFDNRQTGKKAYLKDKDAYVHTLNHLLIRDKIVKTINKDYTWKDILEERLKAGRGSAVKGQKRGRDLEDFVENVVKSIFRKYVPRCSFNGKIGLSKEKADFAIPTKENPEILIEVKGYGATGSKQTDVIGDINRIIQEKRHDTTFILFTDGITWKERESDFRKLVEFQNTGYIYKIYTKALVEEFTEDLRQLKIELNI